MKSLIILAVAFLAVSINATPTIARSSNNVIVRNHLELVAPQNDLVEVLIKFIENLIKKLEETLKSILLKLEAIIENVTNAIQKLIDETKALTERIFNEALKRLEEIAKQNEVSKQCVEKNLPHLEVAAAEYNVSLQKCQANAIEQIQNIRKDIEPHVEAISNNIIELKNIVSECSETSDSPFKLIACISGRIDEVKTQLIDIIKNANKAIATGSNRAYEIIDEARQCVGKASVKFQEDITKVVENVEQCIQDGQISN